ncbi:hypothetical protein [Rhodococcus koreensis]
MTSKRRMTILACAGMVMAGCSNAATTATPSVVSSTRSTAAQPATATMSPASIDAAVCRGEDGLESRGRGFYSTFEQLMLTDGQELSIAPISLSAQMGALTTIGAPGDEIDGSDIIDTASPDVRLALTKMIRDAERLAQHYADVANGSLVANSDLTPIVDSFTGALIACTMAGHQPSWFDPENSRAIDTTRIET